MTRSLFRADRKFRRWEPYVGLLISTGFFTYAGRHLKVLGQIGWAEAIFLGLCAACLVSLALALWRYARPIKASPADVVTAAADAEVEIGRRLDVHERLLESQVEKRFELERSLAKLSGEVTDLTEIKKAIVSDYQRMSGLESRLTDALDSLKGAVRSDLETMKKNVHHLEATINEHHKQTLLSFHALNVRERLQKLGDEISCDASYLHDRIAAGERLDAKDWDKWDNVHHHWSSAVTDWGKLSQWFAHDVSARLFDVSEDEYGMPFGVQDAQFPTADANRRYKRHRIIHAHWEHVREDVMSGLQQVIFHGMSEREVQYASAKKLGRTPVQPTLTKDD